MMVQLVEMEQKNQGKCLVADWELPLKSVVVLEGLGDYTDMGKESHHQDHQAG